MTLLKPNPAPIEDDDIWKDDALGREEVAKDLTKLILSIQQPFVVSVNGSYGSGKTFLLERWVRQLNKDGQKAIYFNAWETDFSDDPLVAFVTHLQHALEGFDSKPTKASLKKLTTQAGRYIGPKIADAALKKISGNTINWNDLKALNRKETLEFYNSAATSRLQAQKEAIGAVAGFRDALEAISARVLQPKKKGNSPNVGRKQNIYVLVDELDRCRPTYAIEFLETVKHLFSVSGFVFVLAVDTEQLEAGIKGVYGQDMDADGYLRRFIDWRLEIPRASRHAFANHLYAKMAMDDAFSGKNDYATSGDSFTRWFATTSQALDLSLREQEQCFTQANVALRLHSGVVPFAAHLGLLVALKAGNKALYRKFCSGQKNYYDVWNFFLSLGHMESALTEREQRYMHSLLVECWASSARSIQIQHEILSQMIEKGESPNLGQLVFPSDSSDRDFKYHREILDDAFGTLQNITNRFYDGVLDTSVASIVYRRLERSQAYSST